MTNGGWMGVVVDAREEVDDAAAVYECEEAVLFACAVS
jgi:hypothetical protein